MRKFSVVLPVRSSEKDLIKTTLPSWCLLRPDELLICVDAPANQVLVDTITEICKTYNTNLRILTVHKNQEYAMHQAWVRRKGFMEAKHDIILTGDSDLIVNENCLKAVEMTGNDNVGLVSLSKLRKRKSLGGFIRNMLDRIVRYYAKRLGYGQAGQAYFTGLYCIYRPYWLDSESQSSIKNMPHPYTAPLAMDSWGGYRGEDSHLRDWMIKKHKCIYLPDIGAEDLRPGLEERKPIQVRIGKKFAYEGFSPVRVFIHSIIHLRPYVFISYVSQLREISGSTVYGIVIKSLVYFFAYTIIQASLSRRSVRVLLKLVLGKEGKEQLMGWKPNLFGQIYEQISAQSMESILRSYRHEFPVSVTLRKIKGDLFVDIGANRGYYSLLLRKHFKHIVAFEPADLAFNDLVKNIRKFATNNIVAEKVAVSDHDGTGTVYLAQYGKYHQLVSEQQVIFSMDFAEGEAEVMDVKEVKTISLSSYFPDKKIDLIKVDVEGAEWQVLQGAEPIMPNIKRWVVELHNLQQRRLMEEYLRSFGYQTRLLSYGLKTCHIYAYR